MAKLSPRGGSGTDSPTAPASRSSRAILVSDIGNTAIVTDMCVRTLLRMIQQLSYPVHPHHMPERDANYSLEALEMQWIDY
jgi:hypothetical protein